MLIFLAMLHGHEVELTLTHEALLFLTIQCSFPRTLSSVR